MLLLNWMVGCVWVGVWVCFGVSVGCGGRGGFRYHSASREGIRIGMGGEGQEGKTRDVRTIWLSKMRVLEATLRLGRDGRSNTWGPSRWMA